MPYREPEEIVEEPPDLELLCAKALHSRAETMRKLVVAPCVLGGIALGGLGYLAVREAFLSTFGLHHPYVSGMLGMLPAFVLAIRGARAVGDVLVRRRMPAWTAELARTHGVSPSILEEHARIALGADPTGPAST